MHQVILKFWFEEIKQSQWWSKDEQFDQMIIERFSDIHAKATHCELFEWRKTVGGRLAEIIILDQFSRNMFRDSPLALALSQESIFIHADERVGSYPKEFSLYAFYAQRVFKNA